MINPGGDLSNGQTCAELQQDGDDGDLSSAQCNVINSGLPFGVEVRTTCCVTPEPTPFPTPRPTPAPVSSDEDDEDSGGDEGRRWGADFGGVP